MNREPFATDETYHVYNRGAHKQPIFLDESDYRRFLLLLHLANDSKPVSFGNLIKKYGGRTSIFQEERSHELVDVIAFCLMPNHFHLVLQQKRENGISEFMRRLGTGYTMYFNTRYEHSGVIFQGRFKSTHVDNDPYYLWIFSYIHLNPIELIEPNWKEKNVSDTQKVRQFVTEYRYSSFYDYCVGERQERKILAFDSAPDFLKEINDLDAMVKEISRSHLDINYGDNS